VITNKLKLKHDDNDVNDNTIYIMVLKMIELELVFYYIYS